MLRFNKKSIRFVTLVVFACFMLVGTVFAADKVAFVNIDKLFDDYQKTLDLNEKLDGEIAVRQSDREKMVDDIRRMKEELVLLSEDNKKGKQNEIDTKIRELQQFDEKTREELSEKRNEYMREILVELDEQVKKYGSEKGYDFIYNGRLLLYQDDKYDITDKILKQINSEYKK
ncbi:MAG: OmpH family outer membrane protein [Candidatus Omnitrophica bacterium]|nr:OmpH family outer membrane protein [Candidatus Omnitrophota bacterium]